MSKRMQDLTGVQLQTAMLTLRMKRHDDAANLFQAELVRRVTEAHSGAQDQAHTEGKPVMEEVDDTTDTPCQPNDLNFCRYCGRDMEEIHTGATEAHRAIQAHTEGN